MLRVLPAVLLLALLPRAAAAQEQPPAAAMSPEAQAHYDTGMAHYAAKEYAAAFASFESGYAKEPRPEFLFAEGQALRLAGNCPAALERYRAYLATAPAPAQVEATRTVMARCEEGLRAAPAPVPTAPPPPVPSPRADLSARPERTSPRFLHDVPGHVLAGVALAGLVGGAVLLRAAQSTEDEAIRAMPYAEHARLASRADSYQRWGWVVTAVGLAAGVGAAARYVWVERAASGAVAGAGARF